MSTWITTLQKSIIVFVGTVDDGSPTFINAPVDTNGWDHATWFLGVNGIDTTLDMKIQEDSDSAFGSGTDITDKALTQLTADSDEKIYAMEIPNLSSGTRERYQQPVITVGNGAVGATFSVWCVLSGFIATAEAQAEAGFAEIV